MSSTLSNSEEISNYTANLNGILHLFVMETQKLVGTYRTLVTYVHKIITDKSDSNSTKRRTLLDDGIFQSSQFSYQWNVILPLIEEMKRLVGSDFDELSQTSLTDYTEMIAQMEDFYMKLFIDLGMSTLSEEMLGKMKSTEQAFPTKTLQLLGSIKKNVTAHLKRMNETKFGSKQDIAAKEPVIASTVAKTTSLEEIRPTVPSKASSTNALNESRRAEEPVKIIDISREKQMSKGDLSGDKPLSKNDLTEQQGSLSKSDLAEKKSPSKSNLLENRQVDRINNIDDETFKPVFENRGMVASLSQKFNQEIARSQSMTALGRSGSRNSFRDSFTNLHEEKSVDSQASPKPNVPPKVPPKPAFIKKPETKQSPLVANTSATPPAASSNNALKSKVKFFENKIAEIVATPEAPVPRNASPSLKKRPDTVAGDSSKLERKPSARISSFASKDEKNGQISEKLQKLENILKQTPEPVPRKERKKSANSETLKQEILERKLSETSTEPLKHEDAKKISDLEVKRKASDITVISRKTSVAESFEANIPAPDLPDLERKQSIVPTSNSILSDNSFSTTLERETNRQDDLSTKSSMAVHNEADKHSDQLPLFHVPKTEIQPEMVDNNSHNQVEITNEEAPIKDEEKLRDETIVKDLVEKISQTENFVQEENKEVQTSPFVDSLSKDFIEDKTIIVPQKSNNETKTQSEISEVSNDPYKLPPNFNHDSVTELPPPRSPVRDVQKQVAIPKTSSRLEEALAEVLIPQKIETVVEIVPTTSLHKEHSQLSKEGTMEPQPPATLSYENLVEPETGNVVIDVVKQSVYSLDEFPQSNELKAPEPTALSPRTQLVKALESLDRFVSSSSGSGGNNNNNNEENKLKQHEENPLNQSLEQIDDSTTRQKSKRAKKILPDGYKVPTIEEDVAFLETLTPANAPEIVFQAVNGYQLLPSASASRPYIRIKLDSPARIGRSNTQKFANFITLTTTQTISRNHADLWYTRTAGGLFWIRDIGSNSGTWVNGQRLSEPGATSVDVNIRSGDIIRFGTDYRSNRQKDGSYEENDDDEWKHRCVIVRVLCREPNSGNRDNLERSSIFPGVLNDQTIKSTGSMTNVSRNVNKQFDPYSAIRAPEPEALSVVMTMKERNIKASHVSLSVARSNGDITDNAGGSAANLVRYKSMYGSTKNVDDIAKPRGFEEAKMKHVSRYFLSFTANTLPFKIKKLSIHNPSNILDLVGAGPVTGQGIPKQMMDLIGPEIVSVSMKEWTSKDKQRLIINDLRIPNVPKPATPEIGTSLEIIKDELSAHLYKVILVTGQVDEPTRRVNIHVATFDTSVPLKFGIQLCFNHLQSYQSDIVLQKPGPTTIAASTPLSKASIIDDRIDGAPPIYKIKSLEIPSDHFPSISLIGDFGSTRPPTSKLDPSLISGGTTGGSSLSSTGSEEATVDKTKLLAVLKRAPPNSRIQKLICEIRGKQVVKRTVMETKWVTGIEILEDILWDEIANLDGMEWSQFCRLFVHDQDVSEIRWVYRKEWWSLILLSAIIFGFLREHQ